MKNNPILLAAATFAVLSLSVCGESDISPKSMEEAKEEAAKLDRPKPGQYKQTMTPCSSARTRMRAKA